MKLVVIAGPANSGKMPLGRRLLAEDCDLWLVHRDHLRDSLEINHPDEWHITTLMGDLARGILRLGKSPLIVAWNLEPIDRALWIGIASEFDVECRWLDVREPEVAAMIPPLPAAAITGRIIE